MQLGKSLLMASFFAFGVATGGCGDKTGSGANVQEIRTAQELKAKMDGDHVMVVHSLNAENYSKGHVPGATNIDYEAMKPDMLPSNKEQPMVFYCAGAMCPVGERAAEKAASWGYKKVWVYKGGMSDWKSSGMPVETGPAAGS